MIGMLAQVAGRFAAILIDLPALLFALVILLIVKFQNRMLAVVIATLVSGTAVYFRHRPFSQHWTLGSIMVWQFFAFLTLALIVTAIRAGIAYLRKP